MTEWQGLLSLLSIRMMWLNWWKGKRGAGGLVFRWGQHYELVISVHCLKMSLDGTHPYFYHFIQCSYLSANFTVCALFAYAGKFWIMDNIQIIGRVQTQGFKYPWPIAMGGGALLIQPNQVEADPLSSRWKRGCADWRERERVSGYTKGLKQALAHH